LVLPVAEAIPHDPATLGVVVNDKGSSKATPEPVVTVTVSAEVLVPSAGRLVGLATTRTAGGGGAKYPKASMTTFTESGLLLNISVAAPLRGAKAKS
jgi:hypothetical protein